MRPLVGGSVVRGLGDGMMLRRDVEDWLYVHDKKSAKLQTDIFLWAKAGAIIGAIGIIVATIIAALGH
jgi:hypothetical protein